MHWQAGWCKRITSPTSTYLCHPITECGLQNNLYSEVAWAYESKYNHDLCTGIWPNGDAGLLPCHRDHGIPARSCMVWIKQSISFRIKERKKALSIPQSLLVFIRRIAPFLDSYKRLGTPQPSRAPPHHQSRWFDILPQYWFFDVNVFCTAFE